jgi:hypothetical protein
LYQSSTGVADPQGMKQANAVLFFAEGAGAFTGCGKTPLAKWFVSGHEFTRAEKPAKSMSGFSPC